MPANHSGNADGRLLGRQRRLHPAGHRDVVLGGVPKGQRRQPLPLGEGEAAAPHRGQHAVVAERIGHHRHAGVVLRRRAHHRRSADVDLLDALVDARAGLHRLAERIQVDHHQFERRDAELLERRGVLGLAQVGQQPGVHPRVQGLDPAVEHLRETRSPPPPVSPEYLCRQSFSRSTRSRRSRRRPHADRGPARPARSCRRR